MHIDNYQKFFSERLTQLRINLGVSSREMSLALGLSEGYINRIENQNNLPSMIVFFYICDYFNITPKQFFDTEDAYPKELETIVKDLKLLNQTQLSLITSMIKEMKNSQ